MSIVAGPQRLFDRAHPAARPTLEAMSTQPSAPADVVPQPLLVRTVALDDLGDAGAVDPHDLLDLLPSERPLAWVRRGDGLVAWGETLRIEVAGADRFADAERAWQDVLARAIVRDEVQLPGTGPLRRLPGDAAGLGQVLLGGAGAPTNP